MNKLIIYSFGFFSGLGAILGIKKINSCIKKNKKKVCNSCRKDIEGVAITVKDSEFNSTNYFCDWECLEDWLKKD